MSWAKGLAVLAGVTKGAARAVEREDEKRSELTKTTLAAQLRNAEFAKELAYKAQEEVKAENQAVDSLMNFEITDEKGTTRAISRSEATAAYRAYGKNATSMLLQGQLSFKGVGKLVSVDPIKKGGFDVASLEGLEGMDGTGLLSKGRAKSIASGVQSGMAASGYSPEGFDIPQPQKIEGDLRVLAGSGLNKVTRDDKYTNIPGLLGGMVSRETTVTPDGKTTIRYLDLNGIDQTDLVKSSLGKDPKFKIADSYSAIKEDLGWKSKGLAFQFTDGGQFKSLGYEIVYTEDGRVLKQDEKGQFTIPVQDKNVVSLPASAIAEVGGIRGIEESMDAIGKEGRKAYSDYQTQAESFEFLETIFGRNIELLQKHGDKLTSDIGSFSNLVTYVKTNVNSGIQVLKDELGEYIDISGIDIDLATRNRENIRKRMEAATDPTDKLALARDLYDANQVVAAYYYAKSTGDTRISNQDFDQFLKTVSAGTAEGQMAIYKDRINQAATAIQSKYTTVLSYVGGNNIEAMTESDKKVRQRVLGGIPDSRRPEAIRSRIQTMFDVDLPEITTEEYAQQLNSIDDQMNSYKVQLVFINEKTGEKSDQSDPDAVSMYAVIKNGKVVRATTGDPIVSAPPTFGSGASASSRKTAIENLEKDLKRNVRIMLQQGYLK